MLPAAKPWWPEGPAVAGVDVEAAQEREGGVGAARVGGVADQGLDHAAPGGVRGPVRVVLGDDRGGVDVVAVVEVVVVEFAVAAVGGRVAGEGLPVRVVGELTRPAGGEPFLQAVLEEADELVAGGGLADLVGERHQLGELAEGLAGPVGVRGAGERVGGVGDLGQVAAEPVRVDRVVPGQSGQDRGGLLAGGEGGALPDLHGAAGGDVGVRREGVGGVHPLVPVERLEGAAFGALLGLGGQLVGGADRAAGGVPVDL